MLFFAKLVIETMISCKTLASAQNISFTVELKDKTQQRSAKPQLLCSYEYEATEMEKMKHFFDFVLCLSTRMVLEPSPHNTGLFFLELSRVLLRSDFFCSHMRYSLFWVEFKIQDLSSKSRLGCFQRV